MGERPAPARKKKKLDVRAVEARMAERRRDVALSVRGMLTSTPEPEEPGTDPAIAEADPPGAPPRVGRIADVEHVDAPYRPPPGASRNARPVWKADGENTGRLVLAEVGSDAPRLPPTLEIALPEAADAVDVTPKEIRPADLAPPIAALRAAIPETRQIVLPEASEHTAVLETESVHLPIRPPASRPRGYEKTTVLSEAQLRGEEPVPMRRSLYDEVTFVLPASALEDEDEDDERTLLDVDDRTERNER